MSLPPREDEVFDLGELERADPARGAEPTLQPRLPWRAQLRQLRWRALAVGAGLVIVAVAIAGPVAVHRAHDRDLKQVALARPAVLAWIDESAPSADSSPARPHATATLWVINLTAAPVVVESLTSVVPSGHASATLASAHVTVLPGATGRAAIDVRASCDADYRGASLHVGVRLPSQGGAPARTVGVDTLSGTSFGAAYGEVLAGLCPGRTSGAVTITSSADGVSVVTRSDAYGVWMSLTDTTSSPRQADFHLTGLGAPITVRVSPGSPWLLGPGATFTAQVSMSGSACGPSTANYTFPISAYLAVSRPGRSGPARIDDLSLAVGTATNALIAASCR